MNYIFINPCIYPHIISFISYICTLSSTSLCIYLLTEHNKENELGKNPQNVGSKMNKKVKRTITKFQHRSLNDLKKYSD